MSSLDPITSPISMENHNHTTTSPNTTNHNTPPESPHEKLIRLLNHSANGRSVSCYGNLYKKPEKNSFLWKRRFCVIYHGILTIYYYENEEKAKNGELRGKIPFCSVHEWDGKPNGFQFFTPTEKCYYVYTEKLDERQKWINHMQSEIDSSVPAKDGITIPYKRQISLSKLDLAENMNLNINAMNQTWIGENPDIKSLLQEISDLRHECSYLKEEIKVYEKAEEEGTINKAIVQTRRRQDSILDDGTTVHLKPSEMQRMRQIFNLFDTKHTGVISAADLRRLHQRLGEPISDAEANEALEFLQSVNHGKLDFTAFIKWWNEDHSMSKEKTDQIKRYQAKFKFLKARITNPDIGHIVTEACGAFPSFEFRLKFFYMNDDGQKEQISPWHDIPLYNSDGSVNFICEIPKWTRKKMEIATGEPFNPIKQDTKNGKLREYTFGDMMFNYGALPQTWEDPSHVTEGTGCIGDNDPIDVIEIGTKQWPTGAIVQVKILGVLALIDSGETDWKVICINVEDHYAPILNDVADVDAQVPGCIAAIRDWLRDYKTPNINKYGYDEKCMSREFAESVVQETHDFWKVLVEERGEHATV